MIKRPTPVYPPDIVERIRAFVRDGVPRNRIADSLGISQKALESVCYKNGIKLPHRSRTFVLPKAMFRKGRENYKRTEAAQRGMTQGQLAALRHHRRKVQMIGVRKRSSLVELHDIVAHSKVKITKLPMGAHAGWTPSWL